MASRHSEKEERVELMGNEGTKGLSVVIELLLD